MSSDTNSFLSDTDRRAMENQIGKMGWELTVFQLSLSHLIRDLIADPGVLRPVSASDRARLVERVCEKLADDPLDASSLHSMVNIRMVPFLMCPAPVVEGEEILDVPSGAVSPAAGDRPGSAAEPDTDAPAERLKRSLSGLWRTMVICHWQVCVLGYMVPPNYLERHKDDANFSVEFLSGGPEVIRPVDPALDESVGSEVVKPGNLGIKHAES